MIAIDFTQEIKPLLNYNFLVKDKASSDEVIEEIVKVINENVNTPFTKLVVKALSYGDPDNDTFVKRVFDYACYAVQYRRDPNGKEIIFTPKLLIQIGKGDCKKFTTFLASVLKTKGIEPVLKVVSYSGSDWEHIYVLYPKGNHYITVDPVNDEKYNKEVWHSHYRLYYLNGTKSKIMSNQLLSMGNNANPVEETMLRGLAMSANDITNDLNHISGIFGMGGIGCPHYENEVESMHGIGDIARKHRLKDLLHKIGNIEKKAGFAVPRAAFLGLLMLGKALEHSPLKLHLAKHMVEHWQKDNGVALSKIWQEFGGNPKVLQRTILQGMKVGVSGIGATSSEFNLNDHTPLMQMQGINGGIGIVTVAAASAAIAASLPIAVKVMNELKKTGIIPPAAAAQVDKVIDGASDAYNADGTHPVALNTNPIVNAGASVIGTAAQNEVAAHTGGDAQVKYQQGVKDPNYQEYPDQHKSMFSLNAPLAFNTWFKGLFLTGLYSGMTHSKIALAATTVCFSMLVITQSYKGIKFLIKK